MNGIENVKLSFAAPQFEGENMKVEELSLNQYDNRATPFKGSRWEINAGQTSPVDKHEVSECWFVANGEGELTCDGTCMGVIRAGDILYFQSNQSHSITNTCPETMLIFSVWWNA